MERLVRLMLFVMLAFLGVDGTEDLHTRQRLDALKPPRIANVLRTLTAAPSVPEPPEPPPPPPALIAGIDAGAFP